MSAGMPYLASYLFAVSLVLICVLTPLAAALGRRWRVLDHPGPRKVHQEPMPLTGGWAIFAAISLVLWGHLLTGLALRGSPMVAKFPAVLQLCIDLSPSLIGKIGPIYVVAVLVFLLGLNDDLRGMSARSRLFCQLILAVGLVASGVRPSLGFLPPVVGAVIAVIWIVGITNSFNLLDGLDGLSCGVSLVATAALLAITTIGNQPDMTFLLAMMSGVQLGFLRFNFKPARIFLGSSGSLLLGYTLAVITILVTYRLPTGDNWLMPLLTPVFILAIPIYDTTSVVLIRLSQKRPIALGDQSHFHHRLLKIGFTAGEVVVLVYLIAGAIGLSAVSLVRSSFRNSLLIVAQIAGIFMILILAERVAARTTSAFAKRSRLRLEREVRDRARVEEKIHS